jgi:signal transduction histidine kinase
MRRRSASLRLTVLVALAISAVSLISLAIQYDQVVRAFDRRQLEELQTDLDGYSALYEQRRIIAVRQAMEFRAAQTADYDRVFLLLDKGGAFLGGNIPAWPDGVEAAGSGFGVSPAVTFALTTPDGASATYLGVARSLPGGFPVLVARSMADRDRLLGTMRRVIGAVALAMAGLSLGAGWMVSRMVLARINLVNRLADQVAAGNIAARIPGPRSDDEFGRLETHVHEMLDRIGALQRATASLSDAIAHELRTPLNRIRQKLEAIRGQDELADELKDELRATIRLFDALLDIAAAEADTGSCPGLQPVDLTETCRSVFDLYAPLGEENGQHMEFGAADGNMTVLGDRNLIAQLVANLLDNALKFTTPGDTITVELAETPKGHRLIVCDTGAGVPDEMRARLFDRFVRTEGARGLPGHGLGLALVRAIATRHGAKLGLPAAEKGFAVEIVWPRLGGLPSD